MKLEPQHQEFVDGVRRDSFSMGRLPVTPSESDRPIFPISRWKSDGSVLSKEYAFVSKKTRNAFVNELLAHELRTQHPMRLSIDPDVVVVEVGDPNVSMTTEIDEEIAAFCDVVFRDMTR